MSDDSGFETERLKIRRCSASFEDRNQRLQLIKDLSGVLTANVLRHLPEPLQLCDEEGAIANWIAAREAESHLYSVRDQRSDILLGLLILAQFGRQGDPRTVHLGYLFAETAWSKGYASELLKGLVQWQGDHFGRGLLLGGVEKSNAASARVLIKNGFVRDATLSTGETDMFSLVLS